MSLPKYKYLLTYRYSEIIHDLTVQFCDTYIDKRSRTHDQTCPPSLRSGAGRRVVQKGEIKLLGVARASLEELIKDYEDFLQQRNLLIYPKSSEKITSFRTLGYRLSDLREKPVLPGNSTDAANFLLTIAHLASYLLHRQISSLEERFVTQGGFTENLFRKRLKSLK